MTLKPLGKNIIFTFVEETSQGGFLPSTGGRIIIAHQNIEHNNKPKWGKVHLVGPDVNQDDIKIDQYVLVEALQWTTGFTFDGTKYWKTDESKVMVTSEVPVISY